MNESILLVNDEITFLGYSVMVFASVFWGFFLVANQRDRADHDSEYWIVYLFATGMGMATYSVLYTVLSYPTHALNACVAFISFACVFEFLRWLLKRR